MNLQCVLWLLGVSINIEDGNFGIVRGGPEQVLRIVHPILSLVPCAWNHVQVSLELDDDGCTLHVNLQCVLKESNNVGAI